MNTNQLLEALSHNISSLTTGEKMQGAGYTTLLAMGTVFVVLILLILVIKLMGKASGIKKEDKIKESSKKVPEVAPATKAQVEDEDEIVAVITAAVCQALGSDSVKIHIKK